MVTPRPRFRTRSNARSICNEYFSSGGGGGGGRHCFARARREVKTFRSMSKFGYALTSQKG